MELRYELVWAFVQDIRWLRAPQWCTSKYFVIEFFVLLALIV